MPSGSIDPDNGTRSAPTTIKLAPSAGHRERALERKSPSALEGGSRLSASNILAARNDVAFSIGTLIHAWLEQIDWLDDGLPSDEVLRQVATRRRAEIGTVSGQLDAHLVRFRKQLAAGPIAGLLSRRFYDSPAKLGLQKLKKNSWAAGSVDLNTVRERGFAFRTGDDLLSGSIDRLVIIKSGGQIVAADVIDFKTDEIPPGDQAALANEVDFYRPQIEAYRMAASRLLAIEPELVAARLVFLAAGEVHSL